jgi:transcriptional regulator with XRE-family HTH domain
MGTYQKALKSEGSIKRGRPFKARSPLGNAILQIRTRLGKTRAELGEQLGCPSATVMSWELGRFFPNAGRLIKLRLLAQTPEELAPLEEVLEKLDILPAYREASNKGKGDPVSTLQSA